ncbi:MAG: leucyl aminopeptidase [Beijerinckiaceae bacterium]|nr:leucyl aminopeptidase [Beijerinckiaceae bacterium]
MTSSLKFAFADFQAELGATLVIPVAEDLLLPPAAAALTPGLQALVTRAAEAERFKAKAQATLVLLAPDGVPVERIVLVGVGPVDARAKLNWLTLGGSLCAKLPSAKSVSVLMEHATGEAFSVDDVADLALGMELKSYSFERYKTKKKDGEGAEPGPSLVTLMVANKNTAKKAFKSREAIGSGVNLARTLVNEPPNVLFPSEFAERAGQLEKLGVEIEILEEKQLRKLGMRALLAVGQGSEKESRVVIMRWNGAGDENEQPVAFVGKGVTFDTGGISIKPAAGMEDMKGDMAGAACVVGLMQALAGRKARVNAIGAIGLVENMPDGNAQRPGDIVTSMSGQTIEIINTDAEGRLVLADVLWHVQTTYKPKFIVDLATLTGAILVALGQEYAGLFSNDDKLADQLSKAGDLTGERVWRLPLAAAYDKMIDSRFADMKNTGGRFGGSITAAQFLQRFVGETPWVHLDIAGTGMSSPNTDTNRSWGSGWGVRLLDRLVADFYEDK